MKNTKYILNGTMLMVVKVTDKKPCHYLEWRSEVKPKLFGLIGGRKEGFYSLYVLGEGYYSVEDIESGKFSNVILIVENKTVYYRPNVKLTFRDDYEINKEFSTYEEALVWGKAQADKSTDSKLQIEI